MSLTNEQIETVKETGICHDVALEWKRFMDGTGVDTPVPKVKATCSVCHTEFVKSVQVVDLDEV